MNAGLHYLGLKDVGYFNSLLYAVRAINTGGAGGDAANELFDIIEGTNGLPANISFGNPGFSAGAGYDNCSGNGSLWGSNFFPQLADIYVGGSFNGISNLNVVEGSTTATATWQAYPGATGYIVQVANLDWPFAYAPGSVYLTKKTTFKLAGLIQNDPDYTLIVWAITPNSWAEGAWSFSTSQ